MTTVTNTEPRTELSFALEHADPQLRDWLRDQPTAVQGVVDLAITDDNMVIVATFAPAHAEMLDEISGAVRALDTAGSGVMSDRDWLDCYAGLLPARVAHLDRRAAVEDACDRLRADVQWRAQLVASLIGGAR